MNISDQECLKCISVALQNVRKKIRKINNLGASLINNSREVCGSIPLSLGMQTGLDNFTAGGSANTLDGG